MLRTTMIGPSASSDQSYMRRHDLNEQILGLETEIRDAEDSIEKWRVLRESLVAQKQELLQQLQATRASKLVSGGAAGIHQGIDYTAEFEWSRELKSRSSKVFGIENFRLCQEGVCNANMDGRDIICIMPTGGGKSLTYQLPALLTPGCTLVISPLLALMRDQILHLEEAGVEAVMLTGSLSKEQNEDIYTRLTASISPGSQNKRALKEIKLCYATPEKISKSKRLPGLLQKLAKAGKLARIVIDEAHCVSQLGHDYRPDYKKLSVLRQLFPGVPILALSATCPPEVLKDILSILRLRPIVDGKCANNDGTIYFTAPLYRKNLHYSVVTKPSSSQAVIQAMCDYILQNHKNETGIVYCRTKKDTESVAIGLNTAGKIKTGIYHSTVSDAEKERLHKRWRSGDVQVVCATIAFGMGIDKGDVRFVLHHTMSKSLESYYQESGRAGRDGKDADCVLYYRPQDVSELIGMDIEGQEKVHDMARFAQDMRQCKKIQFANHFSMSSHLSLSSWTTEDTDASAGCGHCDNCMREPETVEARDLTLEAWQILNVTEAIKRAQGHVTLSMLADLSRGAGGGSFGVKGGGRKGKAKQKDKVDLDLDVVAGGKVDLSKDETERLILELLLSKYLVEEYKSTAYATIVYIVPGPKAIRLTRRGREELEQMKEPRIHCSFSKKQRRKRAAKASKTNPETGQDAVSASGSHPNKKSTGDLRQTTIASSSKRKKDVPSFTGEDDSWITVDDDTDDEIPVPATVDFSLPDIGDDEDSDWAFSFRESRPPRKKQKQRHGSAATLGATMNKLCEEDDDDDIICVSSD